MAAQSNEYRTLEDLLCDDIGTPLSLKLSVLQAITNDFSEDHIIGEGGYGVVYKGVLGDGFVAVKMLRSLHAIEDEPFQREVDCLMRIKHHNIVWFVGYCAETRMKVVRQGVENLFLESREKLLCFEYLHNGSLAKHITDDKPCGLQWNVCYQIIKGICVGLQYLHERQIIHLDLKPENILLDDGMVPKIADFGLARLFRAEQSRAVTKHILGTRGYMAPEYIDYGAITFKSDIYSLGVIIQRMVIGRTNTGATTENVLKTWRRRLEQEYTSSLQVSQTPLISGYLQQVEACIEISASCTEFKPDKRPATEDILHRLDKAQVGEDARSDAAITTLLLGQMSSLSKLMDEMQSMAVSLSKKQSVGGDESSGVLLPAPSLTVSAKGSGITTTPDKSCWLDSASGAKCCMLSSTSLEITWGEEAQYWKWISHPNSRFAKCAELLRVYWLTVIGEISGKELSPGTIYVVYLVYKLASSTAGLQRGQMSSLRLYGERVVTTRRVSLDPAALGIPATESAGVIYPVTRPDGWMELKLVEFANNEQMLAEKAVIVDIREENVNVTKSGIIVEGMEFRPKIN